MNETAKQKVINSRAEFQTKFIVMCPTVSRNLSVPRNLTKSSLNQPNQHKKSNWPNKPNGIWPFFKNIKKPKLLKKAKNYKFGLRKAKLATLQKTRSNECWHFALEGVYCSARALNMIGLCFSTSHWEM